MNFMFRTSDKDPLPLSLIRIIDRGNFQIPRRKIVVKNLTFSLDDGWYKNLSFSEKVDLYYENSTKYPLPIGTTAAKRHYLSLKASERDRAFKESENAKDRALKESEKAKDRALKEKNSIILALSITCSVLAVAGSIYQIAVNIAYKKQFTKFVNWLYGDISVKIFGDKNQRIEDD